MLQLEIENCKEEDAEAISELLEEFGALSVTFTDQYDNPILEPEPGALNLLWPYVLVRALFDETQNTAEILNAINVNYPALTCTIDTLPEQDWVRTALADFKPQQFGENLWVCPSWITPPIPSAINLILDPGLAFGTGSHPTTGLCLAWLEKHKPQNKTVIDYGCGSGILAIAALKLKASHVYAVDIDEQALIATENNARNNQIDPLTLSISLPEKLEVKVDLIIANILLAPLLLLKSQFVSLLKENGTLLVSGILESQKDELITFYSDKFLLVNMEQEAEWAMLYFNLKKSS